MARFFTLDQAHALLPLVERNFRQVLALRLRHQQAEEELAEVDRLVRTMGGMLIDRQKVSGMRTRRDAAVSGLSELIGEIQQWGCIVKDLDTGLCDFPTLYRGQEVYLCWKLGEGRIEYWHGVHEWFRGRKPVDRDFLDHHRGDLPD